MSERKEKRLAWTTYKKSLNLFSNYLTLSPDNLSHFCEDLTCPFKSELMLRAHHSPHPPESSTLGLISGNQDGRILFSQCTHSGTHKPSVCEALPRNRSTVLLEDRAHLKADGFSLWSSSTSLQSPWQLKRGQETLLLLTARGLRLKAETGSRECAPHRLRF